MSKLPRKYLNAKEEGYFLMLAAALAYINGETEETDKDNMIERYSKAGMLTSTSKKNLKTGITFIKKFLEETYNNLDHTTQKRLEKKTTTFNIVFTDKYTANKLNRELSNKMKYVVMERELFNEIIEDIATVKCVNCKNNYEECSLYKCLEDSLTPGLGENNCPYSCNLWEE